MNFFLSARRKLERKMRRDWDQRAQDNARYFVDDRQKSWSESEFYRSGEEAVRDEILTDMQNICQGRDPRQMRILELGCGAGRMTRALAAIFGEVHAVDVSPRMIALAREHLSDLANVHWHVNNGSDLKALPEGPFDFAFSFVVFQHIPSREVIESYIGEVSRLLRPGALFKFQVQGDCSLQAAPDDTWLGVPISEAEAVVLAARHGFECRHRHGAGTQYFRLWYFRLPD